MSSYGEDKSELSKRLRRIEGQVRGIQRMIEQDQYCVEILVQISAARAALNRVGFILLEDHIRGCVARAVKNDGDDRVIDELADVMKRFIK